MSKNLDIDYEQLGKKIFGIVDNNTCSVSEDKELDLTELFDKYQVGRAEWRKINAKVKE